MTKSSSPSSHDYRHAFKAQFVIAARAEGVPIHATSLREFLCEDFDFTCPHHTAGHALDYFCQDGDISLIAIKSTLRFLEETTEVIHSESAIRTLQTRLLTSDRSAEDLIGWARGAFPLPAK